MMSWGDRGKEKEGELTLLRWHTPLANGLKCTTESQMWSNKYRRAQLDPLWGLHLGKSPFCWLWDPGKCRETWSSHKFSAVKVMLLEEGDLKSPPFFYQGINFIWKVILSIQSGVIFSFSHLKPCTTLMQNISRTVFILLTCIESNWLI